MKKTFATALAVAFILGAFLSCEGKAGASGEPREVLIVGVAAEAVTLDPHRSNDSATHNVCVQIYNGLIQTNARMDYLPDLAESWEIIDPLTWEFRLRRGVKWHNGDDFTAEDVKFSIEKVKQSNQIQHLAAGIEEVEIVDPYTVRFKTLEPYAPMLPNLSHSGPRILNKRAVEELGDRYPENPVGTGPFKFVEWVKGDRIVLERFDEHFAGPAGSKGLVFRVIPEGTSRTIALEIGEVDIIFDPEPIDISKIDRNSDTALLRVDSNVLNYLSFNARKEPFNNKLVNQAIAHAISKQDIIEVAEAGYGRVANTVTGPTVFGYNGEIPVIDRDIERAKQLLAEAGYPDGFSTVIWANGDLRNRMAQVVQANVKDIGIDANIELLEWGAYLDRTARGEHEMFLLGFTNSVADGDASLSPNFLSTRVGAGGNRSFYENPEVDRLLNQGRGELDPAVREGYYKDAQFIIMDDMPWVPLYYKLVCLGTRAGLKGIEIHPSGTQRLIRASY